MSACKCPKCGYTVSKDAKRCSTCGLWFDHAHAPVAKEEEDDEDSIKLTKKEKRIIAVVVIVALVIAVIAILVSLGNARLMTDAVRRWA